MRKTVSAFVLSAALSSVLPVAGPAQAATIDTSSFTNTSVTSWGNPDTTTYGQSFTMDTAATLQSFSFWINDYGGAISYVAHIFAFTGSQTIGGSLFNLAGTTAGANAYLETTVSLGSLAVGAGQYVALMQATSNPSKGDFRLSIGADAYAAGSFIYQNNRGDLSRLGTHPLNDGGYTPGTDDLGFRLEYTQIAAVPLPASLPMLAAGLFGLAALARRRRNAG